MKAIIDSRSRRVPLGLGFLLSLLFGVSVSPERVNPNEPGDVSAFDDASLTLLIEEGRRQIDDQSERFRHVCDRAQNLLTVSLAVVGLMATSYPRVMRASGNRGNVALALWCLGALIALVGTGLAAATAVVRATFSSIDTTQISNWALPITARLAADYAEAVVLGESTLAARVTLFRRSVRKVCWAAVLLGAAYIVAMA